MSEPTTPPPPPPRPSSPPPERAAPIPPPDLKKYGLRDSVGLPYIQWTPFTVFLGVLTAVGIMLAGTILIAIGDPELESIVAKDLAQLMVGVALFMGAFIFALSTSGGKPIEALRSLGFRGLAWRLVGLAALAWLAYLISAFVLSLVLDPQQEDVTKEIGGGDDGSTLALIAAGFLIVVVAPVSEEVFFRGFMFAGLRRAMPLWIAAVISAMVWGSLHLTGGNIAVAIQLAVFGVILAYLYEHSGSLWAPIMAHGVNNAIAFAYLVAT